MINGNLTLAQARQHMLESRSMGVVLGLVSIFRQVRLRFVAVPDEVDLPDDMLLGEFRDLCAAGEAKLVVDDMGGGLGVSAPEPELV